MGVSWWIAGGGEVIPGGTWTCPCESLLAWWVIWLKGQTVNMSSFEALCWIASYSHWSGFQTSVLLLIFLLNNCTKQWVGIFWGLSSVLNEGSREPSGYQNLLEDEVSPKCEPGFVWFFFSKNLFILFIYFWLRWVFVAAHGLSLVAASWGYSSLRCVGFLLWWLLLLQSTGSRLAGFSSCGSWALQCRLSSCGARA